VGVTGRVPVVVTVTVAEALTAGSRVLEAMTWKTPGSAGARYRPWPSTVPPFVSWTRQESSAALAPRTSALKGTVAPGAVTTEAGESSTATSGPEPEVPQAARARMRSAAARTGKRFERVRMVAFLSSERRVKFASGAGVHLRRDP